jgi:hypothetical protein
VYAVDAVKMNKENIAETEYMFEKYECGIMKINQGNFWNSIIL